MQEALGGIENRQGMELSTHVYSHGAKAFAYGTTKTRIASYLLDITVFQVVSLLQLALLGTCTWYISAFFE